MDKKDMFKRLIKLKYETDATVKMAENEKKMKAEKIRNQRTERMLCITRDLDDLYDVAKSYEFTKQGGFYRLKTPIQSIVYPEHELEIIMHDNRPYKYTITARKEVNGLIGWMGYSGEWMLHSNGNFALIEDEIPPYSKEILNLIDNWGEAYLDIERGLIDDCNKVIERNMIIINKCE